MSLLKFKKAVAAAVQAPEENVIRPAYSRAAPGGQSAIDVFRGHWKSKLPPEFGLSAGTHPSFEDTRVFWAEKHIPGGIAGRSVLELGPFEAYNSLHLQQLGAREIVAIEGNNINYLKCLVLKETLGLTASFLHGDFSEYLSHADRRFDIIWASGVLYHQKDPLRFIKLLAEHTRAVFFWTHYFDEKLISAPHRAYLHPERDTVRSLDGLECKYHCRSYLIEDASKIPLYFEGGNALDASWLELDDIFKALKHYGLGEIVMQGLHDLNGLPVATFLALSPELKSGS